MQKSSSLEKVAAPKVTPARVNVYNFSSKKFTRLNRYLQLLLSNCQINIFTATGFEPTIT